MLLKLLNTVKLNVWFFGALSTWLTCDVSYSALYRLWVTLVVMLVVTLAVRLAVTVSVRNPHTHSRWRFSLGREFGCLATVETRRPNSDHRNGNRHFGLNDLEREGFRRRMIQKDEYDKHTVNQRSIDLLPLISILLYGPLFLLFNCSVFN